MMQVVVARGRESLIAAQRGVLQSCVVFSLLLIGLVASLSWLTVGRALEPARRLAAAVDAVQAERLPAGLDAGPLPAELRPLAETTDALLERVDTALQRERRTAADIAHELRTPISELLTVSEVALRDGRDPDGARRALGKVRDVAWRMGRSVTTLLKLARLEMGAETSAAEGVDLYGVVRDSLRPLAALERERGLRVENLVEPGELVEGDRDVLRIVASNLLSNALYYAPPGGVVVCHLGRTRDGWRFVVENDALELQHDDLSALSRPFWRKDRARADRNRSGLGLALSRALAERTGMQLAFELEQGRFRALLSRGAPPTERSAPRPVAASRGNGAQRT